MDSPYSIRIRDLNEYKFFLVHFVILTIDFQLFLNTKVFVNFIKDI